MTMMSNDDCWAIIEPWATSIIANQGTGDEFTFNAVFDTHSDDYSEDASFKYSGNKAVLTCRTQDIQQLVQGEKKGTIVSVRCKKWRVSDINPDWDNETISKVELKKI